MLSLKQVNRGLFAAGSAASVPSGLLLKWVLVERVQRRLLLRADAALPQHAFDIPAAPILIPAGPWQEVDGSVCAAKGFKAQGHLFSLCTGF